MGRAMIYAFLLDIMFGSKSEVNHYEAHFRKKLSKLIKFVDDAERKQFTQRGDQQSVKEWLIELQRVVYLVEELLLQTQIKTTIRSFPLKNSLLLNLLQKKTQYMYRLSIVRGPIIKRLDDLLEKKDQLGLTEGLIDRFDALHVSLTAEEEQLHLQGLPSSSAVLHDYFYGDHRKDAFYGNRRETYESVLKHLLSTSAGASKHIKVINIVGKPGVGKTTLADDVYFNHEVRKSFKPRAWVSSMPYKATITSIAKKILEAVTEKFVAENDLDELMKRLNKSLEMKKFLLVLDDFQADEINQSKLIDCFGSAAEGSAIILIPDSKWPVSPTSYTVHLDPLSNADCWSILMVHALPSEQIDLRNRPSLEEIARAIVNKLEKLPLAARMIGSLLQDKPDEETWRQIMNNELLDEGSNCLLFWMHPDSPFEIPGFLVLCYLDLPAQIKRCFAYLSIFPKGYHFEQKEVVLLWMAQGFLKIYDSKPNRDNLEDIGDKYFGHLIHRLFLQPDGSGDRFIMHDLVHDLARLVFEESYKYHLFYPGEEDVQESFTRRTGTSVRTIVSPVHFKPSLLKGVIKRLDRRPLRALSLSHPDITYKPGSTGRPSHVSALPDSIGSHIPSLPDSIGRLKHLCYLDLSFTSLHELPDSICDLLNLQTLLLTNCRLLGSLPGRICNLIKLRYLDVRGTSVKKMPKKMHKLASLRTLTDFIISKNGPRLEELAALSNLKTLAIEVAYPEDGAILKEMKSLDDLMIRWSHDSPGRIFDMQWINNLEPCKDLKSLTIEAYPRKIFPIWLEDSSYRALQLVALRHCIDCEKLPTLGLLPSLKDLSIEGFKSVESLGIEFYGNMTASQKPFQSLESLLFRGMLNWKKWDIVEGTEFPQLIKLCIIGCPRLVGDFPKHLPSLKKMEIIGCGSLMAPFPKVSNTCEVFVSETYEDFMGYEFKTHSQASLSRVTISEALEITSPSYSGFPSSKHTIGSSFCEIEEDTPQSPGSKLPVDFPSSDSTRIPEHVEPESSMARAESLNPTQADMIPHTGTPTTTAPVKVETSSKQDFYDQQSSIEALKVSTESQLSFLPPKLHSLKIEGCESLKNLTDSLLGGITTLKELYLISCSSLESFPYLGFLTTIYIRNCKKLKFPNASDSTKKLVSLQHLFIGSSCYKSLTYLALNLSPQLKTLSLWDCPTLVSFVLVNDNMGDISSLESLEIRDCPELQKFPKEGLHAQKLVSILLSNCGKLKTLPKDMNSLTSLKSLFLHKCPQIESFPSGGLPSSLIFLSIAYCDQLKPNKGWGLYSLKCLDHFELEGGCMGMESFPEEELLPCNISTLRISTLESLEKLNNKGFQHLNALRSLEIHCCGKLRSLPDQGLPSSLDHLCIDECPLLTPELEPITGDEWQKVAHIAHIQIDDQVLS